MSPKRFLAVCVVVGGVLFLAHGPQMAAGGDPAAEKAVPAQVGRFTIVANAGQLYVLDTATGQVWQQFDREDRKSNAKAFLDPKISNGSLAKTDAARATETADPEPTYQGKPMSHWVMLLRDGDPKYCEKGIEAVGKIGPRARAAMPYLITLFVESLESERYFSSKPELDLAEAISHVDPNHSFLRSQLRHKDYAVRRDAAIVLGSLGLFDKSNSSTRSADKPKKRMSDDRDAIPVLLEALKDRGSLSGSADVTFQLVAMKCLGSFGSDAASAVPALRGFLKDKDATVRVVAEGALGKIGPDAKAAVPQLRAMLRDADKDIRASAAMAIGGIEGGASIDVLKEMLKDEEPNVRAKAAKALGGIKGESKRTIPVLLNTLEDPDFSVVNASLDALGNLGREAKAAVPALVELAKRRFVHAISALYKVAPAEFEKLKL